MIVIVDISVEEHLKERRRILLTRSYMGKETRKRGMSKLWLLLTTIRSYLCPMGEAWMSFLDDIERRVTCEMRSYMRAP